ncbi:MAG: efflux RND transporter permease subunit, partial [Planctomycetaceae bacterium]|nr:efflux RND transporter permease subunit [Planctomycetaceae bacterium]
MINAVLRFSLQNRLLVIVVALGVMIYGGMTAVRLPIDVLPDLTRPRVVIITECPGLAPEEVESLVTIPIESAVNGASGVQFVRSSSDVGLSVIYVEFDWSQDIYLARQIVQERMATTLKDLPDGITPELGPVSSLLGQIVMVGLWSETGETDPLELRTVGDWVVRKRLLSIPGVAQVITMGGGRMQFQVQINPHLLHKYEVSLADVEQALQGGNLNVTGGYLNDDARELQVRSLGRIHSLEQIEEIVVKFDSQRPVLVRDIADVKRAAQVKRGDSAVNGHDAVVITIQKQPGADTRFLTDEINRALAEVRTSLPADVRLESTYEQREFIDYSVANVIEAVRDGGILVVIILAIFLVNFRTTFITLTAIPLSILTTAFVFKWSGQSINIMTLGGIAVAMGELVDDAIVDVENIFSRLRENRKLEKPRPALQVVWEASMEVRGAIMMSTILVMLVFAPLFALSGMEGRLFTPLGIAYLVSIIASTLVSLTVTPVLSYLLLPNARVTGQEDGRFVQLLKALIRPVLRFSMSQTGFAFVCGFSLVAVLLSSLVIANMGKDFLPAFDEGAIQVNMFLPPGTSLEQSRKVSEVADQKFRSMLRTDEHPERPLLWFTCKTGRAENDEHVMGVNTSEYVMSLNPDAHYSRSGLIEKLHHELEDLPGVEVEVEQPIAHLISHMLSGVT